MKSSVRDRIDSAQIVSGLAEIARLLGPEEITDARVRRVLELLDRLVPYECCALLVGPSKNAHLFTIPDPAATTRAALHSSLSDMLHVMEGNRDIEPSGTGSAHLVLPVIGADRIIGVLQVERDDAYDLHHVQLLSTVASQLGGYLAMVELKDRERRAQDVLETRVKERTAELEISSSEILTQAKQLQELSVRLMQTQDNERRRISRELHDSVGQYLAHAKMSLESLKRPDATEKETQSFEHLLDTLDKCLTEIRTISYLLHPPLLDELGLSSAVHWYVEGFSERSGVQVKLNFIPHELTRLPGVLELALFRILQESLTNIHRHTHSQSVDIQLKLDADEIALEVRDHGQGMPSELLEGFRNGGGKGIGLRSMNERASELGGRLEIQSDKNGTLVRVTAPLSDAATKSGIATGNPSGT